MAASATRLHALLSPRTIAIVGATPKKHKIAGQLIDSLLAGGFTGDIFPVNRSYETVSGLPCYPSVSAIGREIDHCIISVPASQVPAVLAECREVGVKSAAVFTSGFREVGHEAAERELVEAAGGMPFLGPNCMGMANLVDQVVATTSAVFQHEDTRGTIALVSQSGGLGFASTVYMGVQAGVGFTHVVNIGNGAGIHAEELCRTFEADPQVRAIGVMLEDVRQVEPLTRAPWTKPLILLKLGRTAMGSDMARSHTGSLAGDYAIVRACSASAGITLATDVDQFLTCLAIASSMGTTPGEAAALSISGGNITLLADNFEEAGLRFAQFEPQTEVRLREILPDYITIHNPLDITALGYENPTLHRQVFAVLADDPNVGVVIPVMTTVTDYTPVAEMLVEARKRGLNVIALWTGGSYDQTALPLLRAHEIPVVRYANTLARSLAALAAVHRRHRAGRRVPPESDGTVPVEQWRESAGWHYLTDLGAHVPEYRVGTTEELATLAQAVGYPVVVKLDAETSHISTAGNVYLNIRSKSELDEVCGRIPPGQPLIVIRYVPGAELLVSLVRDPIFGPLLVLASGGTLADFATDTQIIPLPAATDDVHEAMLATIVGRRAAERAWDETINEAVQQIMRIADAFLAPDAPVVQLEMNPFILREDAAVPVDVFVVGRRKHGS